MIDRVRTRGNIVSSETPPSPKETLPYRIELRGDGAEVERVLARAINAALARAIFKAVQGEHPDRRITLSRGSRLIADSAK
jgi:hypothetical protein